MEQSKNKITLENYITQLLKEKNVRATPQAISSISEMVKRCPYDYAGDTDYLLTGLLFSGSYTIDVLENSGVDQQLLRSLALRSVTNIDVLNSNTPQDHINHLISSKSAGASIINKIISSKGTLETSHLLEAALIPITEDSIATHYFPCNIRKNKPPSSEILKELDTRICELITYLVGEISSYGEVENDLQNRRHPVTDNEDWILDKHLGANFPGMQIDELEFAISALNNWFTNKTVLTDPPDVCYRLISRCSDLLIAPNLFAQSGGDIKSVDIGLKTLKKVTPERDLPTIALFMRGSRICVGQFSYRNSLIVNNEQFSDTPFQQVQLQALRPVPLISEQTLMDFENLVSNESLKESMIQNFLQNNEEILTSLGYMTAHSHICLRDQDNNNLIPDFLLELPGQRGFDILDLKLPTARLVARHPYLRISSELMKAVAQLRKYNKFFEYTNNRKAFQKKYGLLAFKPELVVVMGRSHDFRSRDELVEITEQLGNIRLVTYDDLFEYARSRLLPF